MFGTPNMTKPTVFGTLVYMTKTTVFGTLVYMTKTSVFGTHMWPIPLCLVTKYGQNRCVSVPG